MNENINIFLNSKIDELSSIELYDEELHSFLNYFLNLDILEIADDLTLQISDNLTNFQEYLCLDIKSIAFFHSDFIQSNGYSEIFAIKDGLDICSNYLTADMTHKLVFEDSISYKKAFIFNFSRNFYKYINKRVYDWHENKIGNDIFELKGLNNLCQLIIFKGYLGLHKALLKIINSLNLPKNFPFIISEHEGGYTCVVCIKE